MFNKIVLLLILGSSSVWAQNEPLVHTMTTVVPSGKQIKDETRIFLGPKFKRAEYDKLKMTIGWVYSINSRIEHIKQEVGGPDRFDVFYNINELGQRVLPTPKEKRKNHLIVAGDSNTFGIGNKDEETVAFQMGQAHPEYEAYNFGHGGGGPHNTLALLENYPWEKQIKQTDGMMIYIFYPQWMTVRVLGTKDFIKWDGGLSPWYELDKNENLVRKGYFNQRRLSKVLRFIDSIDRFHLVGDLPKVSTDDFKLISKIFQKMKFEYLKKFPKGRFVVAISDYNLAKYSWTEALMKNLSQDGVDYIEIHKEGWGQMKYHLVDFHFNALGNKRIVDEISAAIKF